MQFQYFADPSHDTEAYHELVEHWWDGLCLPHPFQRKDYFCHDKDPKYGFYFLDHPKMYISLIVLYYFPPLIYGTVISVRFYGAKNWLNGVLGNPAYFIFPITTGLSFYEKTNSYENETDRNVHFIHGLDHGESQKNQNVHSSEDRFQLKGIGLKLADGTQSSTNSHDQKSIEEQVVSIEVDHQENDSEHTVVSMCEVREEQVHSNSEVKNQTVSESDTVSSSVNEENKANSSTSMEMTFSVSQSFMLYGYYMCITTFLILVSFFGTDGKFSSILYTKSKV